MGADSRAQRAGLSLAGWGHVVRAEETHETEERNPLTSL